jgi:hypothetical protein
MAGYIINTKKIITAVVRSLTHRLQPQHGILRHNSAGSCVLRRTVHSIAVYILEFAFAFFRVKYMVQHLADKRGMFLSAVPYRHNTSIPRAVADFG